MWNYKINIILMEYDHLKTVKMLTIEYKIIIIFHNDIDFIFDILFYDINNTHNIDGCINSN